MDKDSIVCLPGEILDKDSAQNPAKVELTSLADKNDEIKDAENSVDETGPLSDQEMAELLSYEFAIPEKAMSIGLLVDPWPTLSVDLVVRITFVAFESVFKQYITGNEYLEYESSFNKHHFPPVPQIRTISGATCQAQAPFIKKIQPPKGEKKARLEALAKRAFSQTAYNFWDFKIGTYEMTQRLSCDQIPLDKFVANMVNFPHDRHNIRLVFELEPLFMYVDSKARLAQFCMPLDFQPTDYFEAIVRGGKGDSGICITDAAKKLVHSEREEYQKQTAKASKIDVEKIPSRFKSDSIKAKKNVYRLPDKLKPFSLNAHAKVRETITDFDIKPYSMSIANAPGSTSDQKIAAIVSFTLVRHITGVSLTLVLPIFAIAFLAPFSWYLNYEDLNDVAAYLATLLLTLVAHRQLISDKTAIVQRFTAVDWDFIVCLTLLLGQLVAVTIDHSYNLLEKQELVDYVFWGEQIVILCLGTYRYFRVTNTKKELTGSVGFFDYIRICRQRRELQKVLSKYSKRWASMLKQKSYFSVEMKLLLSKSKSDGFHMQSTELPINDIFRARVLKAEARPLLESLLKSGLKLFYKKEITEANIVKFVFMFEDGSKDMLFPFELQVMGDSFDKKIFNDMHQTYKMELFANAFKGKKLHRWDIRRKLWISVLYQLFTCNCASISTDFELYGCILQGSRADPVTPTKAAKPSDKMASELAMMVENVEKLR